MKVRKDELAGVAKEVLELVRACAASSDETKASSATSASASATIVALHGDLGAGKTTFTQALARELGITEAVQSPTYVLMKSYPINFDRFTKLVHIDAYRLDKPEEFSALKPETFLNEPQNLVVIEWPERVAGFLPTPNIVINFSHESMGGEERSIEIQK